MVRIYQKIMESDQYKTSYSWGDDTDRIWSDHPELTVDELIVIGAYLGRQCTVPNFREALQHLGIR
jgi:hypothetical protein